LGGGVRSRGRKGGRSEGATGSRLRVGSEHDEGLGGIPPRPFAFGRGRRLSFEVIWDADRDLAAPEQESGLDQEGGLIVEQMLPPLGRDEFR